MGHRWGAATQVPIAMAAVHRDDIFPSGGGETFDALAKSWLLGCASPGPEGTVESVAQPLSKLRREGQ